MMKNLMPLQAEFYSLSGFIITPPVCAECENTTVALNNRVHEQYEDTELFSHIRLACSVHTRETTSLFFLRAAADEFACAGWLNHDDAANSSAESNDFDSTCDTSGEPGSRSLGKKIISQQKESYSGLENFDQCLSWLNELSMGAAESRERSLQSTQGYTIAWDLLLFCCHSDKSTTCLPVTQEKEIDHTVRATDSAYQNQSADLIQSSSLCRKNA